MFDTLIDVFAPEGTTGFRDAILIRGLLSGLTALVVALAFGRWFISFQRRRHVLERTEKGDSIRLDRLHRSKSNTPTMGGVIFLLAALVSTAVWARLDNRFVWLIALTAVVLGTLGFVDDRSKLGSQPGSKGISARVKLAVQFAVGLALGVYLYLAPTIGGDPAHTLHVPFVGPVLPLGVFFILVCAFCVAGTSNAVNLTDGLDGLAMGCAVLVCFPLAIASYMAGSAEVVPTSTLPFVPGSGELFVALLAWIGAGLGFLWFNCHPARVFMGDTGALPLGGVLGLVAVIIRQEVLFLVISGVFVAEAMSVILQVGSFKLRRKRIFLIAPLHHHFQFKGWAETKVTVRFWIAAAILSAASMLTLNMS